MSQVQQVPDAWRLDGGPDDALTPRDLFRAMCIARAMQEDRMAERLRQILEKAFIAAGQISAPESSHATAADLH